MSEEGADRAGVLARAIITHLYVLTRNLGVHGAAHPLVHQNAEQLAASLDEVGPPYAIQFVSDALFVDRALAVLDPPNFLRARKLAASLRALKVNELRVEYAPSAANLVAVAAALAEKKPLPGVDGMVFREIDGTRAGTEALQVDPELFATAQLLRGVMDVEAIVPAMAKSWPWSKGIAAVRRVERARETDLDACLRFLDHAPGVRGPARRAVGAAVHGFAMTGAARFPMPLRRVVAHGALALVLYGHGPEGAVNFRDAAGRALPAMVESIGATRAALDPHRMKVCAALQSVVDDPTRPHPLAAPMALAYSLERVRALPGLGFEHANMDLLSWAARIAGARLDARWVQALLSAYGVLAPGARLRTLEGGDGWCLGGAPEDAPRQPLVLLDGDGTVLAPEVPVDFARVREA